MRLYYKPGACSLAPHILLREIGADFDLELVDTAAGQTSMGADFSMINPKGYVPVLELEDGYPLTEGVVIQQYLADFAPNSLAPARGGRERMEFEELLVFLATEVHKTFIPLFRPTTPEEFKPLARDQIGRRFDLLEARLADGRTYLMGERFTCVDAYCFTLVRWSPRAGVELGRWPLIEAFVGRVSERPAVRAAMAAEGLA